MLKHLATAAVAVALSAATGWAQESDPPTAAPGAPTASVEPSPDLSDRQALETFIDEMMAAHLDDQNIAGAVIAIVRDGEVYFTEGYGYADLEAQRPVDPTRTLFRVGSLAKLFAGTAVLQLVERGELDLDVDVNGYLSTFQIPATFPQTITLRHLLTHSAGFEERVIGYNPYPPDGRIVPLAQSLPESMPARVRPPGEVASYCNWSVTLAGHIVEEVSGLDFAEYVERHIFGPLDMARSTFREPLPALLADDLAVGYAYEDGRFVAQPFEFISDHGPAGALSSTADDMARFMIAHLQQGRFGDARILGEDTIALMHRRHFAHHPGLPGIALSFGEMNRDGRRLLAHSGATFSFHANLGLLPDDGVGSFVAYNGMGSAGDDILMAFLDRYFPRPEPAAVAPPADFDDRSGRYAGSYRNNRLAFTRLEKAMRFDELTVHVTDRNTLFLGDLLSDTENPDEGVEFVEIEPNLFRETDGDRMIAFAEDEQGRITHLLTGAVSSFQRVAWYETVHVLVLVAALSSIIFVIAGLTGAWVLLRPKRASPSGHPWPGGAHPVLFGLCAVNALFAIVFATMVSTNADPFHYPAGIDALLALPVLSVGLTAAAAVYVLLAWIRRRGTRWARLRYTGLTLLSAVFLWFLDLWNVLGWNL